MPDPSDNNPNANGGDNGDGGDKPVTREEFQKLQTDLKESGERLSEAQRNLSDPDYLEWLAEKNRRESGGDRGDKRDTPSGDKTDLSGVDWETLSNKELAGVVVQVLRSDFKAVAENIDGTFEKLNGELHNVKMAMDIDRVASKHPDFWEHKDAIMKAARENPGLSAMGAYKMVIGDLVKSGKLKPDQAKPNASGSAQDRPGSIASRATKPAQKKSLDQALDDAFEAAGISGDSVPA